MGYASHKIGYEGYVASNDVIVEDATIYTVTSGTGYTTKITGDVLTDLSDVSELRFKISLQHDVTTSRVTVEVYIGGVKVWTADHNNPGHANYTTYDDDIKVSWSRGARILVKAQTLANGAHLKDFQICGKINPMRLD